MNEKNSEYSPDALGRGHSNDNRVDDRIVDVLPLFQSATNTVK